LPSSSASPRGQHPEGAYFFNSTPHIDTASVSCSSTAINAIHLPAPLEAYLVEQIPSKAVRGWQEEQVRQWLADHSLAHYADAFSCINGLQLYELAWQRIRGCDSFFRSLSSGMNMPLYEQLLLSSALASLHNYPDSSPSS
uniref:SAM domain-containing protein n=1 Tax=Taenia asiatica TaxID=60517 RepID=A0A0R3VZG3_TAEAS